MANRTALILGQSYSFTDAKVVIAGVEMFSASAINVTESQEKTNNYGLGNNPVSRGRRKKEYDVSFDLSLKDVERLKVIIPGGSLNDLPISVASIILDNGVDAKHRFDLTGFEFSSDGLEISLDDTESRRTYTGICADLISTKLL